MDFKLLDEGLRLLIEYGGPALVVVFLIGAVFAIAFCRQIPAIITAHHTQKRENQRHQESLATTRRNAERARRNRRRRQAKKIERMNDR